ncbi:MAG: O-methyltransferase, partial [Longimicrobiales bacterium]
MGDAVRVADPDALAAYVEALFAAEDATLSALRAAVPEAGFPEIMVSAGVGRLLQVLLVGVGARRVLEVGTLGGYSAIWMARALPADGRLITIEDEPARAE